MYPSAVGEALRQLEAQQHLGPFEMKLLNEKKLFERDPIIAPDGNSPFMYYCSLLITALYA